MTSGGNASGANGKTVVADTAVPKVTPTPAPTVPPVDAALRLGVNLDNLQINNGAANVRIDLTQSIANSDVQTLVGYAKSQGATTVQVNTGYIANTKLMDFLNARVSDGRPFMGGTVILNPAKNGDFLIVFK